MNTYHITHRNSSCSTIAVTRGILTATVALALWIGTLNSHADPMTLSDTSLTQLELGLDQSPAAVGPVYSGSDPSWTGTWSAPAQLDWQGSFTISGPLPTSGGSVGTATYEFSTLPSDGYLPTGSYFVFGDLDYGSAQDESYTLTAYDPSGNLITSPWLEGIKGTGGGVAPVNDWSGVIISSDMPSYEWTTNSSYYFTGDYVSGNPTIDVAVKNNVPIGKLIVSRDSFYNGFGILAPVPEPSTAALLTGSFGAMLFLLRRRKGTAV